MSSQISKQGKVNTAIDRLNVVESRLDVSENRFQVVAGDLKNIADFVNREAAKSASATEAIAEIIDAVVSVVGKEQVDEALRKVREEKDTQQVTRIKDGIAEAVAAGVLKVTEAIDGQSVVCFSEKMEDGSVVRPGYAAAPLSNFAKSTKEALIGKKVGDAVSGVGNTTLTVEGIYVLAQPAAPVREEVAKADSEGSNNG